jgi:hypothetical protein
MTTRLKGFTVVLDHDIRDDDAETIKQAILALRHVQDVQPVPVDVADFIIRARVRRELLEKVLKVIEEN